MADTITKLNHTDESDDVFRKSAGVYVLLYGPGGSGKTLTALLWALRLAEGQDEKIYFIDSDAKRGDHYRPTPQQPNNGIKFTHRPIGDYYWKNLVTEIDNARRERYPVIIIDSLTKFWTGINGLIETNNTTNAAPFKGNTQAAWSATNRQEAKIFQSLDWYIESGGHVIMCAQEKNLSKEVDGKMTINGTAPELRDSWQHKFNIIGRMSLEDIDGDTKNVLEIKKSTATVLERCGKWEFKKRPVIPAGTKIAEPDHRAIEPIMSHYQAGSAALVDYASEMNKWVANHGHLDSAHAQVEKQAWPEYIKEDAHYAIAEIDSEAYMQTLADMTAGELRTAYVSVTKRSWPESIVDDVREVIKDLGEKRALTKNSPPEQWDNAIRACRNERQLDEIQKLTSLHEVTQKYFTAIAERKRALTTDTAIGESAPQHHQDTDVQEEEDIIP